MSSRDRILAKLRDVPAGAAALPDTDGPWTTYPDPVARFTTALEEAAGRCVPVIDPAGLPEAMDVLLGSLGAHRVHSAVAGLGVPAPPGADADLDATLLPGELAVAENGAVWVTERAIGRRAPALLARHLVLVVPRDTIVHTLHEAYARLSFLRPGFGMFLAGPSKTADIEQTLVIGAQGSRSLTVLLVDAGGNRPAR